MSKIICFSKGLYSSWFYHAPTRSLFDCGEGCASYLGNKVSAVQNIFLSHGHNDHIAGLLTFIAIRASGQVAKVENKAGVLEKKPLAIYYPRGDRSIINLARYIHDNWWDLGYGLSWNALDPEDCVSTSAVDRAENIIAFRTRHHRGLSLGYKVTEKRRRLKHEYHGQDIAALIHSKQLDPASVNEEYNAKTFVYTLDSTAELHQHDLHGADEWVADTTFLNATDRDRTITHGTINEMVLVGLRNKVKKMYCAHFSPRYSLEEITHAIERERRFVDGAMVIIPITYKGVHNF